MGPSPQKEQQKAVPRQKSLFKSIKEKESPETDHSHQIVNACIEFMQDKQQWDPERPEGCLQDVLDLLIDNHNSQITQKDWPHFISCFSQIYKLVTHKLDNQSNQNDSEQTQLSQAKNRIRELEDNSFQQKSIIKDLEKEYTQMQRQVNEMLPR